MAEVAHVGADDHGGHAGRLPGARGVDAAHPRMRMGAAHEGHVE